MFSELFPLWNKYYTKLCRFQKESIWSVQNQCKDMITSFQNMVPARWLVTHQKCPRILSTSKESLLILSGCLTAWAHGWCRVTNPIKFTGTFWQTVSASYAAVIWVTPSWVDYIDYNFELHATEISNFLVGERPIEFSSPLMHVYLFYLIVILLKI